MNKIEVGNITEQNDLVHAGAVVVTEILGIKNRKSTGMGWKRRMEAQLLTGVIVEEVYGFAYKLVITSRTKRV